MKELPEDLLNELLEPKKRYDPPKQVGPLRFTDRESRCASRGCSSPTYLKLEGVPRCSAHALVMMNEMLVKEGKTGETGPCVQRVPPGGPFCTNPPTHPVNTNYGFLGWVCDEHWEALNQEFGILDGTKSA